MKRRYMNFDCFVSSLLLAAIAVIIDVADIAVLAVTLVHAVIAVCHKKRPKCRSMTHNFSTRSLSLGLFAEICMGS